MRLKLLGANPRAKVIGLDKLRGKSNYFIGNDPKKWRTNVPNYAKVRIEAAYPGIDVVYYGNAGQLEHDFVVSPGADPKTIKMSVEGADDLSIDQDGSLVAKVAGGQVVLEKPVIFQSSVVNPKSRIPNPKSIEGGYKLLAKNQIAFEVGPYDKSQPLVIDPTLNYLATFGGTNGSSLGHGIAIDSSGNAYVAGWTLSTDFVATPGAFQTSSSGSDDAVVLKLDPSGGLLYATFLGGSSEELGLAIAIDSSGNAYVTGATQSSDFPVLNAFQPSFAGGLCGPPGTSQYACSDAFITELNPTGSGLIYSSYLGGTGFDRGDAVALDSGGNAYVSGNTESSDFQVTANAFQPVFGGGQCGLSTEAFPCDDAFVAKVAAGGSSLIYSTYLGGSNIDLGFGIALDPAGNAYVGGLTDSSDFPILNGFQSTFNSTMCGGDPYSFPCSEAFLAELDSGGSALVFSTYLGGSGNDQANAVALDSLGNIYVAGETSSTDFPIANAFQPSNASVPSATVAGNDVFVTEFSPGGAPLVYSTYLGGSGDDLGWSIALDSLGEAYITGETNSTDLPIANALQPTYGSAILDAFVAGFQAGGQGLVYSTYLGGDGQTGGLGIAADASGNAWVTGFTNSSTFAAAISHPQVVHLYVAPRPLTTTAVNQGAAGSIALDMARVNATPASLAFGSELAGTTSTPQTVTVSNPGTAPLTFSEITASSNFSLDSSGSTCSTSNSVPPGGSCTASVAFAPTVGGNLTGTLTFADNGIGSPHTVALSGKGTDFTLATAPGGSTSATVTAGETATYRLSVAPTGFAGNVSLDCTGAPRNATCTAPPNPLMVNGTDAARFTVSVNTAARAMAPSPPAPLPPPAGEGVPISSGRVRVSAPRSPLQPFGTRVPLQVWLMAAILFIGLAAMWRTKGQVRDLPLQWRRPTGPSLLAATLLLVVLWAACGGGAGGGGNLGTPAGTYTLTVTATYGSASRSIPITLVVN